ncbi:MAG TPA: protein kinase [Polyangiaceae bacterium]|nr:protein kinase [Polyangiaceae bacterium]
MAKGALELGRILVVDDEPLVARMAKNTLAGIGYEVETAQSGSDALASLRERHFDLVISDLFMPDITGKDLLETIREAGLDTDVLIMSGAGSISLAVDAMKHGAKSFVEKPFAVDDLRREVRAIFKHRRCALEAAVAVTRASSAPTSREAQRTFPEEPGREFLGRYEIRRRIGEGGMGRVYEAFDPNLQRSVAIKVMLPERDARLQGELTERFRREGWLAGQLVHPHIVAVYDAGQAPNADYHYLVMEMVAGGSLRQRLDRLGRLPVADAVAIGHQLASALRCAHQREIIHRDVKPENILFGEDDIVKLGDFGVARVSNSQLTGDRWLGSPAYLAPEVIRGRPCDFRSDQFALGAVLIEMVSGVSPFAGETPFETLHNVVERDTPHLMEHGMRMAPELDALIERLLEKDPARRFEDEAELVQRLGALRQHLH